jgi:endonuclease-8
MWAAELAATIGVHPMAATGGVDPELLAAGLTRIRRRMLRAMTTVAQRQRRELLVFERTGQGCRTCGTPIRHARVGAAPQDRPTYWCPSCQPG